MQRTGELVTRILPENGLTPSSLGSSLENRNQEFRETDIQIAGDDNNMSDISDLSASSVASVTDSLLSILSNSLMSSVAGPEAASQRLVDLLLGDDIIQALCVEGVSIVTPGRFERNLRRLLNSFAVDLKKEPTNQQERHAAQFVRFRARNSAHIICNSLSSESKPSLTLRTPAIFEDLPSLTESDRSEDTVDDFLQLEAFIKAS